MNNNYSIGTRLRELRRSKGLSQEQLALRADITTAYLGQVERNEKNPTVVIMEKLCNALEISLSDFFSNQPLKQNETDVVTGQILYELKNTTELEKIEILHIIQHALKLKSIK
ncbi:MULTISPECIES: helix-turn-helix domain-containing protein [Clostridiaceae]|uniref:Helix-turn-helix transcriptional regulator n=1 Tax=Clostridium facile TaxID=2763035 RepID=A0ABR7IT81_9CLOT|nr:MULTISPECIES: helix-turn-helix transcriptional regulator [Clostridiaceae]MBC5788335.1 helix-turn-helix transcriptional regulator [Clostridium facile]PWN00527.1 MAG: transcriptional regulator [Massilioclostridium sp.]